MSRKYRDARAAIWSYRRAAVCHPVNVAVLTLVALTAIVMTSAEAGLSIPVIMFVVAELIVVGLLPRTEVFQKSIEARDAETERVEAATARAILAAHLETGHRLELEALERTADVIRAHAGVTRLSDDWTGASELVGIYGRAALAYRSSVQIFGPSLGHMLDEELRALEAALAHADQTTRPALLRRINVVRGRKAAWLVARRQQETLAVEMAMIGDQLRSMREQCALVPFSDLREELDAAVSASQEGARVLRELAAPPPPPPSSAVRVSLGDGSPPAAADAFDVVFAPAERAAVGS